MYTVYILYSQSFNRYYVGHAQNLEKRMEMHNTGKVRWTKSRRPWEVVYTETFETRADAAKRELQIKSYKGGEAFKKLIP